MDSQMNSHISGNWTQEYYNPRPNFPHLPMPPTRHGINRGCGPRRGRHPFFPPRGPRPFPNFVTSADGFKHSLQRRTSNSNPPWMTDEILKLIKEKDELYKTYCNTGSEESYKEFKIKRVQVNMAVNDAKILFFQTSQNSRYANNKTFHRASVCSFYCGPCEKEFINQETLDKHKAEHMTCRLDGCTYTAHVKLVMRHIELQHSTNLYNRIKGYDTPEDIKKWRDDRRRNFPTPENVDRKRKQQLERESRGEVLQCGPLNSEMFRIKIASDKFPKRSNHDRREFRQNWDDDEFSGTPNQPKGFARSFFKMNDSPVIKLRNFYNDVIITSTGKLTASSKELWTNFDIESENGLEHLSKTRDDIVDSDKEDFCITDEEEFSNSISKETKRPNVFNASGLRSSADNSDSKKGLCSLVQYSSDSELEVEEGEITSDIEKIPSSTVTKEPIKVISTCLSSDDEPPTECLNKDFKPPEYNSEPALSPDNSKQSKSQENLLTSKVRKRQRKKDDFREILNDKRKLSRTVFKYGKQAKNVRNKYTLLQRLLAPEIRKERNMVLQVCRHIVDNNFWEAN